ncbi:MAG: pyruvate synthase subunit PorA [Candidatus Hydrothermarchaeota archaeon]
MEGHREMMHGSRAVAEAVKLSDVKVIAAYPITPQTHIVEDLAEFIANGELKAEYIKVESEHSAMSACIGASATGARTFTATASQGLALMHELLFVASGMRLPIVMANANRALSAPLSIWNDQQDTISERDAGWIQLYVENGQEALDTTIQAFRIAEDRRVSLPTMVCLDGFVLTHTVEPVEVPSEEMVEKYIPPFKPSVFLDPQEPMTQGAFAEPPYYTEFRREQEETMRRALEVIREADREYGRLTGRSYGLLEEYNTEGAEVVLVTMGSVAGTIKEVIDALKVPVGLIKLKAYRPLPKRELLEALKGAKVVGVLEKDVSVGLGEGALFSELKGLLYRAAERPKLLGFIAGLGGRDITPKDIEGVIAKARKALKEEIEEVHWVGLKVQA